jgi:putative ABC transport system permease protein
VVRWLVVGDLRRHPAAAAMLVISIAVAVTVLSLGISLTGASERIYGQTREATAGPDVVTLTDDDSPATTRALQALAKAPGVAGGSRVYSQ